MLIPKIFRNCVHFLLQAKICFPERITNKEQKQECIPIF